MVNSPSLSVARHVALAVAEAARIRRDHKENSPRSHEAFAEISWIVRRDLMNNSPRSWEEFAEIAPGRDAVVGARRLPLIEAVALVPLALDVEARLVQLL